MIPVILMVFLMIYGVAASRAMGRFNPSPWRWTYALSEAPAIAFGILSCSWFASLYLGTSFLLMLLAIAPLPMLFYLRPAKALDPNAVKDDPVRPQLDWPRKCLKLLGVLALLATLAVAWHCLRLSTAASPDGGYDAIAIWNFAARLQYRAPELYAEIINSTHLAHHMDYPLFLSSAIAAQWSLLGGETDAVNHMTHLVLFLGLVAMVYRTLIDLGARTLAPYGASLVASCPIILTYTQDQYGDAALAYFFLGATCMVAEYFRTLGDRRPNFNPLVTGFFLALLPWTKNEGIPLALIIVIGGFGLLIFTAKFRVLKLLGSTGLLIIGAALPLGSLLIFKRKWSPDNDLVKEVGSPLDLIQDGERWQLVSAKFAEQLNPYAEAGAFNWGIAWPILAMFFLCGLIRFHFWRCRGRRLISLVLLAAMPAWFMVYILTPRPLQWHLDTSQPRLMMQLFPLIVVLCLAAIEGNRRQKTVPKEAANSADN